MKVAVTPPNIELDECNRLHDVFYDQLVLFSRVLVTFGEGCPLYRLYTLRGEWVLHGIVVCQHQQKGKRDTILINNC